MNSAKLIEELVRDEELRTKPYLDTAVPPRITIGIGRNLSDKGISREEAYHLLNNDIEEVVADLDHHLPWWRQLDEVRQRALANMTFNMGIDGLLKFHSTLLLIQLGKYDEAAEHLKHLPWQNQVKDRATRIEEMLKTGGNT